MIICHYIINVIINPSEIRMLRAILCLSLLASVTNGMMTNQCSEDCRINTTITYLGSSVVGSKTCYEYNVKVNNFQRAADLSHLTFGLCPEHKDIALTYDCSCTDICPNDFEVGKDPTSGTEFGVKFDSGQQKGTEARYCYCLEGTGWGEGQVTVISKGSTQFTAQTITGPECERTSPSPTPTICPDDPQVNISYESVSDGNMTTIRYFLNTGTPTQLTLPIPPNAVTCQDGDPITSLTVQSPSQGELVCYEVEGTCQQSHNVATVIDNCEVENELPITFPGNCSVCVPAVEIEKYITAGLRRYALLDGTNPDKSDTSGCQANYLELPEGWVIAPFDHESRTTLNCHTWGTECLVFEDGSYNPITGEECHCTIVDRGDCYKPSCCGRIVIYQNQTYFGNFIDNCNDTDCSNWELYGDSQEGFYDPATEEFCFANHNQQTVFPGYGVYQDSFFTPYQNGTFRLCAMSRNWDLSKSTNSLPGDYGIWLDFIMDSNVDEDDIHTVVLPFSHSPNNEWQHRCTNVFLPSGFRVKQIRTHILFRNHIGGACFKDLEISKLDNSNLLYDPAFTEETDHTLYFTRNPLVGAMWESVTPETSFWFISNEGVMVGLHNDRETDDISALEQVVHVDWNTTAIHWGGCIESYDNSLRYNEDLTKGALIKVDVYYKNGTAEYGKGMFRFDTLNSTITQCFNGTIVFDNIVDHLRFQLIVNIPDQYAIFTDAFVYQTPDCEGGTTTTTHGDPHMVTIDGLSYDLQTVGEFDLSYDDRIQVQIRHSRAGETQASVNSAVLIKYGNHRLMIERNPDGSLNPHLYINEATSQSYGSGDRLGLYDKRQIGYLFIRGSLETPNDPLAFHMVYTITGHGVDVIVRKSKFDVQFMTILVTYPTSSKGSVYGLLGNYDGNPDNDLMTRNGTVYSKDSWTFEEKYNEFAESFRLNRLSSYFYYVGNDTTETFQDPNFPDNPPVWTNTDRLKAEMICTARKLSSSMLEACIFDVLVTGDEAFAVGVQELDAVNGWIEDEIFPNRTLFQPTPSPQIIEKTKNEGAVIAIGVVLGVCVIVIILAAVYFYLRYREKQKKKEVEKVRSQV